MFICSPRPLAGPKLSAYATVCPDVIARHGWRIAPAGPIRLDARVRGNGDVKRTKASGRHLYVPRAGSTARALPFFVATSAVLAVLLSGCASNGEGATAALPSLPSLPKISLPEAPPPVVGSSTEVYERIGRGAMACWFGTNGFLKSTHIYEAMAEPAHKGGKAEILIRERDNTAESPRGVKAFRISIMPSGSDETSVVAENLKLPEPIAAKMTKSVAAWSIGDQGCDPDAFKGAWQAEPAGAAKADAGAQKQKTTQPKRQVAKEKL